MVERLFLAVPRGSLQFVIVVFPDRTHLLFLKICFICYGPLVALCHAIGDYFMVGPANQTLVRSLTVTVTVV